MNLKKAKFLRKLIKTLYPDKPEETRYIVLRADTPNQRQFKLYDCHRGYYQALKKEIKQGNTTPVLV